MILLGDKMYNVWELKKIRKQNGFTINDMSLKLRVTPSYYWKIENKRRRLFYDMSIRIARIFDVKPDDLFYVIPKIEE